MRLSSSGDGRRGVGVDELGRRLNRGGRNCEIDGETSPELEFYYLGWQEMRLRAQMTKIREEKLTGADRRGGGANGSRLGRSGKDGVDFGPQGGIEEKTTIEGEGTSWRNL